MKAAQRCSFRRTICTKWTRSPTGRSLSTGGAFWRMKTSLLFAARLEQHGTWSTTIWSWCNEHRSPHCKRPPAAAAFRPAACADRARRISRLCAANALAHSRRRLRPPAWRGVPWGFSDLLPNDDCRREEPGAHVRQDTPGLHCRNCHAKFGANLLLVGLNTGVMLALWGTRSEE